MFPRYSLPSRFDVCKLFFLSILQIYECQVVSCPFLRLTHIHKCYGGILRFHLPSNSQNAEIQKWSHYIKGDVKRQDYLAEALKWICDSKGMSVDAYMSQHRHDTSTGELECYFRSVIDWTWSASISDSL